MSGLRVGTARRMHAVLPGLHAQQRQLLPWQYSPSIHNYNANDLSAHHYYSHTIAITPPASPRATAECTPADVVSEQCNATMTDQIDCSYATVPLLYLPCELPPTIKTLFACISTSPRDQNSLLNNNSLTYIPPNYFDSYTQLQTLSVLQPIINRNHTCTSTHHLSCMQAFLRQHADRGAAGRIRQARRPSLAVCWKILHPLSRAHQQPVLQLHHLYPTRAVRQAPRAPDTVRVRAIATC